MGLAVTPSKLAVGGSASAASAGIATTATAHTIISMAMTAASSLPLFLFIFEDIIDTFGPLSPGPRRSLQTGSQNGHQRRIPYRSPGRREAVGWLGDWDGTGASRIEPAFQRDGRRPCVPGRCHTHDIRKDATTEERDPPPREGGKVGPLVPVCPSVVPVGGSPHDDEYHGDDDRRGAGDDLEGVVAVIG